MTTSPSASLAYLNETDYFSFLIDYATRQNFSVALWRLPAEETKHLIISKQPQYLTFSTTLEELPTGFIFAPFDPSSDRIFLQADFSFTFSGGQLRLPISPKEQISHAWLNDLITQKPLAKKSILHVNPKAKAETTDKAFFLQIVADGIKEIESGTFEKIVLSRTQSISLPLDLDLGITFKKLCDLYPNALISFVSIAGIGSWLGASPELLVSVENKKTFKTTALAGTQPFSEGTSLKTVAWTQKDIEEQALVERYIISCFKKIRLREYEEHGPRTVIAGNLMHLKSDFTVDMEATNFPQLGSVMLRLLHPTSAVCGVPLDTALAFVNKREGYSRQFYTGYLGPVNFQDCINLFVNLRCMQFMESGAMLYAGAGITQDSVPVNEWEETELKLNTLLKVIDQ